MQGTSYRTSRLTEQGPTQDVEPLNVTGFSSDPRPHHKLVGRWCVQCGIFTDDEGECSTRLPLCESCRNYAASIQVVFDDGSGFVVCGECVA